MSRPEINVTVNKGLQKGQLEIFPAFKYKCCVFVHEGNTQS